MSPSVKYAFRCANCGHLAESGEAGERNVPAACRFCGHGVRFDPVTGIKEYDEANWEILSDLSEGDLKKVLDHHRLEASVVAKHKPAATSHDRDPQNLERSGEDGVGSEDKL